MAEDGMMGFKFLEAENGDHARRDSEVDAMMELMFSEVVPERDAASRKDSVPTEDFQLNFEEIGDGMSVDAFDLG